MAWWMNCMLCSHQSHNATEKADLFWQDMKLRRSVYCLLTHTIHEQYKYAGCRCIFRSQIADTSFLTGVGINTPYCWGPISGKVFNLSQSLKQHAYIWAVTSTVQWVNSFWECIHLYTCMLSPIWKSMFNKFSKCFRRIKTLRIQHDFLNLPHSGKKGWKDQENTFFLSTECTFNLYY